VYTVKKGEVAVVLDIIKNILAIKAGIS